MKLKISNNQIVLCVLFFAFIISSCKKEVIISPNIGISKTKLYNDSTVSADNPNIRLTAGPNGYFMTYGVGAQFPFINGVFLVNTVLTKVMAADLGGNFLWQAQLPLGLEMGSVVATDDGGCIVSSTEINANSPSLNQHKFYLFHFNNKGEQTEVDSLLLPYSSNPAFSFINHGFYKAADGQLILYGTIYDAGPPNYDNVGFALSIDEHANINWCHFFDYRLAGGSNQTNISDCVQTNDGNFIFAGTQVVNDSSANTTLLVKTNSNGETIDSTFLCLQRNYGGTFYTGQKLVMKADGNIDVYFNDSPVYQYYTLRMCELNSNLDSLFSKSYTANHSNFGSAFISDEGGNTISLVNDFSGSVPANVNQVQFQFNSRCILFGNNFSYQSTKYFQLQSSDFITAAVKSQDGTIACFGLVQAAGKNYFNPELIFLK